MDDSTTKTRYKVQELSDKATVLFCYFENVKYVSGSNDSFSQNTGL